MWRNVISHLTVGKCPLHIQNRGLMMQEHLGLSILKQSGIPTLNFGCATTPQEAEEVARELGGSDFVLKAQVQAGGRGKGRFSSGLKGDVHMVWTAGEVRQKASKMIGYRLTTKQTDERGQMCEVVMVCNRLFTRHEYYFGLTIDRTLGCPLMIGSDMGGVNIEDVALENPSAIIAMPIDVMEGLTRQKSEQMAIKMGVYDSCLSQAADVIMKLYETFIQYDCTLLEVNPLAVDNHSQVLCMDCKMLLDDNANFRHKNLFDLVGPDQMDTMELRAFKVKLNYIKLTGNIGCIVNGAGLAMATMDSIKLQGGNPANFLDIGGGAAVDQADNYD